MKQAIISAIPVNNTGIFTPSFPIISDPPLMTVNVCIQFFHKFFLFRTTDWKFFVFYDAIALIHAFDIP